MPEKLVVHCPGEPQFVTDMKLRYCVTLYFANGSFGVGSEMPAVGMRVIPGCAPIGRDSGLMMRLRVVLVRSARRHVPQRHAAVPVAVAELAVRDVDPVGEHVVRAAHQHVEPIVLARHAAQPEGVAEGHQHLVFVVRSGWIVNHPVVPHGADVGAGDAEAGQGVGDERVAGRPCGRRSATGRRSSTGLPAHRRWGTRGSPRGPLRRTACWWSRRPGQSGRSGWRSRSLRR